MVLDSHDALRVFQCSRFRESYEWMEQVASGCGNVQEARERHVRQLFYPKPGDENHPFFDNVPPLCMLVHPLVGVCLCLLHASGC